MCVCVCAHAHACTLNHFSHVRLLVTLQTVAHQSHLSKGFSRQEYWSGLLCPLPGCLPNPGVKLRSLASPALAGRFFTTSTTWEAKNKYINAQNKTHNSKTRKRVQR